MFYENRPIALREVEDAGYLAMRLLDTTWTLCTGWRLGDIAFVNDSTSEDGVAEYAVLRVDGYNPRMGLEIGSISVGFLANDPPALVEQIVGAVLDSPRALVRTRGHIATVLSVFRDPETAPQRPLNRHPNRPNSCPLCV